MITLENLSKSYGKLKVLNNISAQFNTSQVVSIIGPNGSGKTTMIKCLLGMVIPDSGRILVDGQPVIKEWAYRCKIGYMPQISRFPDNMKVRQLFKMMRDIRKSAKQMDNELFDAYSISAMCEKSLGSLSGGNKQKVSAALAFLFDPEILVLDEPTAGLDPLSSEILKTKIVKEKSKGKLILISSHIMSEIDELADDIFCLVDGNFRFYQSIESIKEVTQEARLGKAIAKMMTV